LRASFRFHPGRQLVVCTAFLDRRAASGASADQDVVPRQTAARYLESSPEPVRDFRSATAEPARLDALRVHQEPQPPVAPRKAEFQRDLRAALQKARLAEGRRTPPLAVPSVMEVESV
jgi:hypothetical protein